MIITQNLHDKSSSKGNQLKWHIEDIWYKGDYLGYEGLSEVILSKLFHKTNIPYFVDYSLEKIKYHALDLVGCKSNNFLKEGDELLTLDKFFLKFYGMDIHKKCIQYYREDRAKFVVDKVIEITGLTDFGKYLTLMLEMDAFFLNEDRHFNNIAVICKADGSFDYCPFFDQGAALLSDTMIEYPMSSDTLECIDRVEAKPFSPDFDEQVEFAENIYGTQFKFWFTKQDFDEIISEVKETGLYSDDILNRVSAIFEKQLKKYRCYEQNGPVPKKEFNISEIEREDI